MKLYTPYGELKVSVGDSLSGWKVLSIEIEPCDVPELMTDKGRSWLENDAYTRLPPCQVMGME